MPNYSFVCDKSRQGCGTEFTRFILMSDYDCEKNHTYCPKCGELKTVIRNLEKDLPRVFVKLADCELKLGHLGQRNNDRFSADEKADIIRRNNAYKESNAPLPDGMTRLKKSDDIQPLEPKPKRKPKKKHV